MREPLGAGLSPQAAKLALVAALEREVRPLIKTWTRVSRQHEGRNYIFFEHAEAVCLCAGIGTQAARRATEALIALYNPAMIQSVGFAGALSNSLHVGDILTPATVLDARDNSRYQIPRGQGTLITFMEVADSAQKKKLAAAYAAQAVDMEAAAVAAAAQLHNIPFAATKVISDELDFEMPNTARFITSEGQFKAASFAFFTAMRPWLWPRVATLAANSSKAANALAQHLERSLSNLDGPLASPNTSTVGGRN